MTKFKKVSFTAAGTAVVLGITIGLTFPGFAKALSAPKPIQAVSAAVVVQPTVTTVTTPKQLAPKVAPVTGPTTQVAPSITTTTQEAIITYMDLSGYCTTVDVSNAPSGAVNEIGRAHV